MRPQNTSIEQRALEVKRIAAEKPVRPHFRRFRRLALLYFSWGPPDGLCCRRHPSRSSVCVLKSSGGAGKWMANKKPRMLSHSGPVVPVVGVEPTRCCHQRILSPSRLPIPTHRLIPDYSTTYPAQNQARRAYFAYRRAYFAGGIGRRGQSARSRAKCLGGHAPGG